MQALVGTESEGKEGSEPTGPVFAAGYRPQPRQSRLTPELLASITTALVVVGTTLFVIWQLHPMTLLFTNTMDVGGDNAAHVAAPYYLIHDLLPHFQLSGWDPQWFDGFPLYVFYFPLPALLVALFNSVMPYAVAFKLVTVAGTVLTPLSGYIFGRLVGFRRPIPALMSALMLPFLWNTSYTIDGGNIASTMAGEFSFSLAMVFGIIFLGLVANGLRTGRYRGLAALFFALTLLCHIVPGLFFAFAAAALAVGWFDRRRLWYLAPTGITGALLAGFFIVPFGAYLRYTSSMGYTRVPGLQGPLFPGSFWWVLTLAGIAMVIAFALRHREAIVMVLLAVAAGAAFLFLPSGQVYNGRWLPFWFLMLALLAAYGAGEAIRLIGKALDFERWHEGVGTLVGGLGTVVGVAVPLGLLAPFGYTTPPTSLSFVPGWISWNYTGYQGKEGWNDYEGIVQLLDQQTAIHGCGRLEYEYTGSGLTEDFGSTLAFMSLPMWTNNCIDTTEGLYFESSTTTPFHFLDQSEIAIAPSDPVVGIPYQPYNPVDGIKHIEMMGVKYLLAGSTETEDDAAKDPELVYLGSAPGVPTYGNIGGKQITIPSTWKLYMLKDSSLVAPLAYDPVVESGMSGQAWLNLGIEWYQNEKYWDVPLALGGPSSWPRANAGTLVSTSGTQRAPSTQVSDIVSQNESISFNVSNIGTPVVVRIPYFPNWQASGAEGPWEMTPNLMVVVPTSHHVTLTYGISHADWAGYGASAIGLGLLTTFAVVGPLDYERLGRRWRRRAGETGDDGQLDGEGPGDGAGALGASEISSGGAIDLDPHGDNGVGTDGAPIVETAEGVAAWDADDHSPRPMDTQMVDVRGLHQDPPTMVGPAVPALDEPVEEAAAEAVPLSPDATTTAAEAEVDTAAATGPEVESAPPVKARRRARTKTKAGSDEAATGAAETSGELRQGDEPADTTGAPEATGEPN